LAGGGVSVLDIVDGHAGGSLTVWDFDPSQDQLTLTGYGSGEASNAVANQSNSNGSTTLTLSDGTRITLVGVASVSGTVFS